MPVIIVLFCSLVFAESIRAEEQKTLTLPEISDTLAPGKRTPVTPPAYRGTKVHHMLYLPPHWQADWKQKKARYPLVVEYSGNKYPQAGSTGEVVDSALGFGLSGGRAIWLNLPFISKDGQRNETRWWGDEKATLAYAKKIVPKVIAQYGVDPNRVILCGFSRGAIAVSYIGLHDDEIAKLWSAFATHDHFDGEKEWPGTQWGSPLSNYRKSAKKRLARIKGRPFLICQNPNPEAIKSYLKQSIPLTNFTFLSVDTQKILGPFPNKFAPHPHTDRWLFKPSEACNQAWEWFKK